MKKSLTALLVFFAFSTATWAGDEEDLRIIQSAKAVTVAQAMKAADETAVILTGTVVRQIKNEHYELKDASGHIVVDIDDKLATAAQLAPGTQIKVTGEVDTHRYKPADIDAVKIEIVK
ncbi:NirD/YgiW/YdeI family stress tolerance protein [Acinetobacter sp. WCHAc010052]|uniref:NirD/YgiW/YdeI family stress tolerance protein n=1 Tax=Acinetobacter sp. WCHAc010052 TaxID=2004647 RepID=UPI000B3C5A9E|nr:NirD/YgiW/YdeI family stress tolerance protein [Acinetobacter sp. WCHAc010052]AXY61614.1 NirD/YgiW/YdeI family stress tolerance protein [Acinetobacter sp. WCHAc010052]